MTIIWQCCEVLSDTSWTWKTILSYKILPFSEPVFSIVIAQLCHTTAVITRRNANSVLIYIMQCRIPNYKVFLLSDIWQLISTFVSDLSVSKCFFKWAPNSSFVEHFFSQKAHWYLLASSTSVLMVFFVSVNKHTNYLQQNTCLLQID